MRLLICDDHLVFAESLACVLVAAGRDIVGVTHSPGELLEVLCRDRVDVCLLDVRFGTDTALNWLADVRAVSPQTRIVLLTAQVDGSVIAAGRAARVEAVAEKSRPVQEIMEILDRVCAGESVLPSATPVQAAVAGPVRRPHNDGQRLAGFLTPRERQVLSALVRGDNTHQLAGLLGITSATARCHVHSVLTKLGAHSRIEAATSAVRYGMIDPQTGDWVRPEDGSRSVGSHVTDR